MHRLVRVSMEWYGIGMHIIYVNWGHSAKWQALGFSSAYMRAGYRARRKCAYVLRLVVATWAEVMITQETGMYGITHDRIIINRNVLNFHLKVFCLLDRIQILLCWSLLGMPFHLQDCHWDICKSLWDLWVSPWSADTKTVCYSGSNLVWTSHLSRKSRMVWEILLSDQLGA